MVRIQFSDFIVLDPAWIRIWIRIDHILWIRTLVLAQVDFRSEEDNLLRRSTSDLGKG